MALVGSAPYPQLTGQGTAVGCTPMPGDGWDPSQYGRFRNERRQPFDDLLALVHPVPGGRIVDLGCGTGELTRVLHSRLEAADTLGLDRSAAMLAEADGADGDGIRFALGDIATWSGAGYDVVFANASLHWVPDHRRLLPALGRALAGAGQLAFQVPANGDHLSHTVVWEVAAEAPFAAALSGRMPADHSRNVLAPEAYASLLDESGFADQQVRLQVYGHHLASAAEVVEWVKGTALTPFRAALADPLYEQFVARYREALLSRLGDRQPYFYPFKRILVWARGP
jgi:trans-aconitate 2-methyltransferase